MAENMTGTGDIAWDQEAWNLLTEYSFRDQLHFAQLATESATAQSHPGSTVNFTFTDDLDVDTTPLSEKEDVTSEQLSSRTVPLEIHEYGKSVESTALLRGVSYIPVDPVKANVVGYNAGLTHDTLARDALLEGDNIYGGTSQGDPVVHDVIDANAIRRIVAQFRRENVPDFGGYYVGFVHPDQAVDLREDTGPGGWRTPREYVDPGEIYRGEIGAFEGVRFVEAPRVASPHEDGHDNYKSIFLGQHALAKGYSSTVSGPAPQVVIAPVIDKLRRFAGIGWYWLGGYGILRQESLIRMETDSAIDNGGDNGGS